MDEELRAELTELQRGWLTHLQACERSGSSLKAYATREGIAYRRLCRFKRILTEKGVYREGEALTRRFVRAQVAIESEPASMCRVRFRNGCVLELRPEPSAGMLRELIQTLSRLP